MHADAKAASGSRCDAGYRLPKSDRLRQRDQYRRVYQDGVRAVGRYVVVFALKREQQDCGCRLGVTASRRVGGAVVRARCRRRLRELYRLHRADLSGMDADIVLNARAGCGDADWAELEKEYRRCVKKLRERLAKR
jgi:ribonuclease P protein component